MQPYYVGCESNYRKNCMAGTTTLFLHSTFSSPKERIEAEGAVHGYLGNIASREAEQFFSNAELEKLAHRD